MVRWLGSLILVFATVAATGSASGKPTPGLVELFVRAEITINPEGRITSLQWADPRDAVVRLARSIEPTVMQLEFEPGLLDGQPAVTETSLMLVLHVTGSDDEGLSVAIQRASTGATSVRQSGIQYPPDAARAGAQAEVVLLIALDEAGKLAVEDATYIGTSNGDWMRKKFIDAASKGVAAWEYRAERVGGHPLATRMSVTVSFCLDTRVAWCDGSPRYKRLPSGEEVPANQSMALGSAVKLKTDLASLGI